MAYLRLLLLPFSLVYGLVIWVRNRLYDWGWLRSTAFNKAVIVVGNLAVGGTGKSPMTEYLVRLLSGHYQVATLSRGYGRKTRGFLVVGSDDTAAKCGDEPLQFKRKFPQITVAVDENRVEGVERLIQGGHEAIVLDDAYQHRALRPGFSILLFDFGAMSRPKWLLPAGDYRDGFGERRRADVMVVTKTPHTATEAEKDGIRRALSVVHGVPIFFSSIGYGSLAPLLQHGGTGTALLDKRYSVLLLTGIANPKPLYDYLRTQVGEVVPLRYADHHAYNVADIRKVISRFSEMNSTHKFIVTTEKDAQRLLAPALTELLVDLPVYMLPIQAEFDSHDDAALRELILNYCTGVLGH